MNWTHDQLDFPTCVGMARRSQIAATVLSQSIRPLYIIVLRDVSFGDAVALDYSHLKQVAHDNSDSAWRDQLVANHIADHR